jgi:hypothetical protein
MKLDRRPFGSDAVLRRSLEYGHPVFQPQGKRNSADGEDARKSWVLMTCRIALAAMSV